MTNFGAEVKRLRSEKDWTQAELAFYSKTSQPTINQIENGKRNPSAETLMKLAEALGVEVMDLFPKPPAPQPSLEDAAQSEAFQGALAVLFRGLAERGQRIVEQSRKHGPSEDLTRELHRYQAERKALLQIKKTPSIFGHDSDELSEAEDAYLEVNDTIFEMTRQDVEATEEERGEVRKFKAKNKDYEIEEPKADAS